MGNNVKIILRTKKRDFLVPLLAIINSHFSQLKPHILVSTYSFILSAEKQRHYDVVYIPTEYFISSFLALALSKALRKISFRKLVIIFQNLPLFLSIDYFHKLFDKTTYTNILRYAFYRYGIKALHRKYVGEILPYIPLFKLISHILNRTGRVMVLCVGLGLNRQVSKLGIRSIPVFPPVGVAKMCGRETPMERRDVDIVYVGGLMMGKGVIDFLKALTCLYKELVEKQIKIRMTGPLTDDSYVNKTILSLIMKLRNKGIDIEYLGFVNKDIYYFILSHGKLMILPSYGEGFPITILESLQCNLPVLTYRAEYSRDLRIFKGVILASFGSIRDLAAKIKEFIIDKKNIEVSVFNSDDVELSLKSFSESGVEDIKDILDVGGAEIHYLGSSNFSVSVSGRDFKEANNNLEKVLEEIEKRAKKRKAFLEVKKEK